MTKSLRSPFYPNKSIKISLITPCRNSESLLSCTLESIYSQSALAGGSCSLEHLICDGNSSDNSREIAARFPNSGFISEPDTGMYDALSKGLSQASGDIVGYLNAGDILFPWAFDVLLEVFSNPDVHWATGYSTLMNSFNQITACWKPGRFRREFVLNGFYADPSYPSGIQQESTFWSAELNRKIDLEKLRSFKLAGDYFLWTEFAKHTNLHSIMSPLGAFQIHGGQLSEHRPEYHEEVKRCIHPPTTREKFTAWWETRCNPLLRGPLWNYTLGKSPAKLFEYDHERQHWGSR
jgi:glycosyltransferase involved in cell wall biosynthesis